MASAQTTLHSVSDTTNIRMTLTFVKWYTTELFEISVNV